MFNLNSKVMKRVTKIKFVVISLLLITGGLINGQGWGRSMDPGVYCGSLPGITEKQKAQLTEMATKHRAEMDALRLERWNSADRDAWNASAVKMTDLTIKHRTEILNILTPEQKEYFMFRGGGRFMGPAGRMGGRGPGRGMMMGPGNWGGRGGWRR
jgi:Spy/CpxP family protein refolding chaperone